MDQEFDLNKSLQFACKHLATQYPGDALAEALRTYYASISANDPRGALRELERIGQQTAPGDYNFWSYLESTASQLELTDLADEYLHKHHEAYVDKAVAMPGNCRGLPTMNLYSMSQAGLIVLSPSGVAYWNQTCGNACGQRAEEGVLIPLLELTIDEDRNVPECPLISALASLNWGPVLGIDQERAAEIDTMLERFYWTHGLTVDRTRLGDSEEAWVYLGIDPRQFRLAVRLEWTKAVLVWPNSD